MIEKYLCLNITEAIAEVEACKAHVANCQNNVPVGREDLKLAKAALRSAERELRDWQRGIVPPLVVEDVSEVAMSATAIAGR
jgi:hypothetical protein